MESIYNSGIQFIQWLQGLGSWLTPIMKLFTFLGSTQFYLLVAPALLWCIDATLGVRLGVYLMISGVFNTAFKVLFHAPRPYWYSSEVKVLGSPETSFGIPSGHSQNAVVVWGTLADRIHRRWAWIAAIIIMFMIGISRLYLAVHFPQDVLLGWLIGAILLWIMLRLEKPVINWIKQFQTGIQLLIIFLFSLLMILVVLAAQLTLRGWSIPVEWVNNAHLAFPDEPAINPLSFHSFLPAVGAFFGLAAGWIWIVKQGGFSTNDVWWKLLVRFLVGLVGVLILYLGLNQILTDAETFISYTLRYIQYAAIGFWISGLAPWVFIKVRIATNLSISP